MFTPIHLFDLVDEQRWPPVLEALRARMNLKTAHEQPSARRYFDTFDWRLYQAGLQLYWEDQTYCLWALDESEPPRRCAWSARRPAVFWRDFKDPRMAECVRARIADRALLPLVQWERHATAYRALNEDGKTVLRIELLRIEAVRDSTRAHLPPLLAVHPVRGFDDDERLALSVLYDWGLRQADAASSVLLHSLRAVGHTPDEMPGKPDLCLRPEQPAVEAARTIHRRLLDVVLAQMEGLKADIDTEFLHQYRVALRRMRSALTQLKGVFPKRDAQRFKRDLGYAARVTNRVRDLDVYLLKKEHYLEMLPESLKPGLRTFFAKLAAQRTKAFRAMLAELESPAYRKALEGWQTFIETAGQPSADEAPRAADRIDDLARIYIRKGYRRALKAGASLTETSPDEAFHALRIECKKLRYSIELFASLFSGRDLETLLKQLKSLQSALGDFNDLCVQQRTLLAYMEGMKPTGRRSLNTAAAIGGLIAELHHRALGVKRTFAERFERFADKRTQRAVERLTGPLREEASA